MMFARPSKPIVSPALRNSARGMNCTVRWSPECDGHESTILAHIRTGGNAGIGQKPNDTFAVYACFHCHNAIDGRGGEPVPAKEILRALSETQQAMLDNGLISVKGTR
jgi:uncharacterized CHY-type Zn-finger protein